MDTRALDKIHSHYNADHDLGPDAPIHWSVEELACLVEKLVEKVEYLEAELENVRNDSAPRERE
jgi:hypothetical protein